MAVDRVLSAEGASYIERAISFAQEHLAPYVHDWERVGRTPRNASMWGPPGHAYVYLCYGLHNMLNLVTNRDGEGSAVLIRSCEPVAGLPQIQGRRSMASEKPLLLTGPGKIGQALGVDPTWSHHPLFKSGGLTVHDAPVPADILAGPRVGIDYAQPSDRAAPWRLAVAGTPWVSVPRSSAA